MNNTYKKIDYKIRPQKRIERALFSEVINSFTNYINGKINYVGMGSLFYADFVHFNKTTNLDKMISVELLDEETEELNEAKETRFNNNKPLEKIDLFMGYFSDAITEDYLPFEENNFVWIDYDSTFHISYLDDLINSVLKEKKTSIFAVSFNENIPKKYIKYNNNVPGEINSKKLVKDLDEYAYAGIRAENVTISNYSSIIAKVFDYSVKKKFNECFLPKNPNFEIEKITEIRYSDGAPMVSYVWLLNDKDFPKQSFLEDIRNKGILEVVDLNMEILTLYEKQVLDRENSTDYKEIARRMGLDEETVKKYFKYSKYIPEYTEVLI